MNTFRDVWMSLALTFAVTVAPAGATELGKHGLANSDGVKIHYVALGTVPPL